MGGAENKKMRISAALLACLLAGTAPALAQSASKAADPATAAPVATLAPQAVDQAAAPVAKPATQAPAQPAAKPVQQAAAEPAAQCAECVAAAADAKLTKPSAAKPIMQAATQPTAQPATLAAPAAKPATKTADAACPGHPDALGTERVLTITPSEFQLLGVINYKQTLPLKDHEVVLTFDDGPIPPYTNSVLDTLAANCVKATYFLVGEMAQLRPYLVRRIYNEGHSIGTHSQHHPFAFQRLSMARVEREVDGGIASVDNALGDARALSPFFRIPGFGRTTAIDHFLENKGLITWSADVDTDDWQRGTTPSMLIQRTMRRLNARGRGIILMHDIHPDTALALPALLKELKKEGYHVVHVVAAGERPKALPEVIATKIEKEIWPGVLHAKAEKAGAAMSALRHRVKTVLARRSGKHRYKRTHTARADLSAKSKSASGTGHGWQISPY
jgi:peptidoglycan/xylan/chitin deacetylase (PgdA/CDA1 family)